MSKKDLEEFILKTGKDELMNLLQGVSATKIHELEDVICHILDLMN